ncbi:hypothetical protein CT694_29925 (plasmid) [Bacillus wiedmannii bv. thuringiensis]|nr:hypothetical protein CT694_29925 [Bacillus wiedmannii bv. thuringiensis]
MEIVQIKNILRKKATLFRTGGKRPDLSINESWIGRITYSLPNETYPIDRYQEKMYAIMMLNLTQIPFVPEAVQNYQGNGDPNWIYALSLWKTV